MEAGTILGPPPCSPCSVLPRLLGSRCPGRGLTLTLAQRPPRPLLFPVTVADHMCCQSESSPGVASWGTAGWALGQVSIGPGTAGSQGIARPQTWFPITHLLIFPLLICKLGQNTTRRLSPAGAPGRPWARPQASRLCFSSEDLAGGGRGGTGSSSLLAPKWAGALGGLEGGVGPSEKLPRLKRKEALSSPCPQSLGSGMSSRPPGLCTRFLETET